MDRRKRLRSVGSAVHLSESEVLDDFSELELEVRVNGMRRAYSDMTAWI